MSQYKTFVRRLETSHIVARCHRPSWYLMGQEAHNCDLERGHPHPTILSVAFRKSRTRFRSYPRARPCLNIERLLVGQPACRFFTDTGVLGLVSFWRSTPYRGKASYYYRQGQEMIIRGDGLLSRCHVCCWEGVYRKACLERVGYYHPTLR